MADAPTVSPITLRAARADDVPLILRFIRRLAEYERLAHECVATEDALTRTLFGDRPGAEVVLAFVANEPAGFALFFHNYSTFLAKPGLYLEDLFVDAAFRGLGVGRVLLAHLAAIAELRGCGRFEWSVLDWNVDAIAFYEKLGARGMSDWTVHRVTDEALVSLAAEGRAHVS